MGQFFLPICRDRKEFVRPTKMGQLNKLFEICGNPWLGWLPYLLRESDRGGGGDIQTAYTLGYVSPEMLTSGDDAAIGAAVMRAESRPLYAQAKALRYAGRWAGCRIAFIGDYGKTAQLYEDVNNERFGWVDISDGLKEEYNAWIKLDLLKLREVDHDMMESETTEAQHELPNGGGMLLMGHVELGDMADRYAVASPWPKGAIFPDHAIRERTQAVVDPTAALRPPPTKKGHQA